MLVSFCLCGYDTACPKVLEVSKMCIYLEKILYRWINHWNLNNMIIKGGYHGQNHIFLAVRVASVV